MAKPQQEQVDALVAQATEMSLDEVVWNECMQRHFDDEDAQTQCQKTVSPATQTLLDEFPELAKTLVLPSIQTMLDAGVVTLGQTKFGGVPDVGPDFNWPVSVALTLKAAMRDYPDALPTAPVAADAMSPMSFVAQLDLAALSKLDADYPSEGRLLFFMDWGAWFSENYTSEAAILWDQTPATALVPATRPAALTWMDDVATGKSGSLGDMFPAHGLFVAPETLATLKLDWTRIWTNALEYEDTAYARRVADTGAADFYLNGYLYEVWEDFYSDAEPGNHPPQHQISGVPVPEQDDPRYDAVFLSVMGRLYGSASDVAEFEARLGLTGDALKAHQKAEALKHKLLLQLDVASFMQVDGEGHFYFLIHQDDLKARDFSKVMVIYQQT